MARASAPPVVVTDGPARDVVNLVPGAVVVPLAELTRPDLVVDEGPRSPHEIAYVQYTSGSISDPKPVLLRQEHVLAQLRQAAEVFCEGPHCVSVNWVPLHHDMGLVTSVLRPLWSQYASVLMDPLDFVGDPAEWLRAMSRWRATHTSAPDFGYALSTRKAAGTGGLDLSSLRVARTAGEPVRAATIEAFSRTFASAGFHHLAFNPSYGLAEATLTVTATAVDDPPRMMRVSGAAMRGGRLAPAASSEPSRRLVSSGRALPHTCVRILDPQGEGTLRDGEIGEVWISGPQVAVPAGGGLLVDGRQGHRTGDMGALVDGELFLMGRAKERFQIAGENYYSGDVEAVATSAHRLLRPGRGVCFATPAGGAAGSRPTLLLECRDPGDVDEKQGSSIVRAVVSAVRHELGLAVRRIGILEPGATPLTTSGKVRRERCRQLFEDEVLPVLYWYEGGVE